jgi:hypothetical protein
MRRTTVRVLALGVGAALCAGIAAAQTPRGGPAAAGWSPSPGRGRVVALAQPRGGLEFLLAADDARIEVENTDRGVDLVVTTVPERVQRLQARLEGSAMVINSIGDRPVAGAGGRRLARGRGWIGLVIAGQLHMAVRKADDGAVVSLTSDVQEVVDRLQQEMPGWVEAAEGRADVRRRRVRRTAVARQALRLIASGGVRVDVRKTEQGVTVAVTADRPELVERIQQRIPEGVEALKGFAEQLPDGEAQWAGRGERARDRRERVRERTQQHARRTRRTQAQEGDEG